MRNAFGVGRKFDGVVTTARGGVEADEKNLRIRQSLKGELGIKYADDADSIRVRVAARKGDRFCLAQRISNGVATPQNRLQFRPVTFPIMTQDV